jgi:hypothetical protein
VKGKHMGSNEQNPQPPIQPSGQPPMQAQQPYQQAMPPMPPNPYAPQQPYGMGGAPYQQGGAALHNDKSTLFIILSVVEFFFGAGFLAVIPLILAIMYKGAFDRNAPLEELDSKKKSAFIALIVVGILGLLAIIMTIVVIAIGITSYGTAMQDVVAAAAY